MMRNALQTLLVILLAAPVLFAEDAGKDDEIRITSTPASEWTEGIEYFQKQTAETTSHQLRRSATDRYLRDSIFRKRAISPAHRPKRARSHSR
jgi:hypothetical protein